MHHSCGNGTCCSPSKLWRQIQTIIRTGNEQEFVRLCGEGRAPHVARVLLTQRLVNDPAMYPASHKHRVLQFDFSTQQRQQQALRLFGTSVRDLNALQMALFLRHEVMARSILLFLQQQVNTKDLYQFVNHTWGQKNTSLHLAAYSGMVHLVQLLLDCGANLTLRNTRQRGPLDGCTNLACIQLLQQQQQQQQQDEPSPTIIKQQQEEQQQQQFTLPRTSMLLKKAVQHVSELPILLTEDHHLSKPPLVLSSSTSSSSFSSLSSLDEPLSPIVPPSPLPPDLQDDDDDDEDDRCWTPPITPPCSPHYQSSDEKPTMSPNPMDATSFCHRHLRRPIPLRSPPPPPSSSTTEEEEEEHQEEEEAPVLMMKKTSIRCTTKKQQPKKSVRFHPEIILLDACIRGDVEDVMQLVRQEQQQDSTKTTWMILETWQQQASIYQPCTSMLHLALLHRQEKMAKCLISLGADVNAMDQDGWTPLHYAATLQLWSTVECLIRHEKILLDVKTHNGLKVYDCPRALVDQRRCRGMIERVIKQRKQGMTMACIV